jgi:hypothetical protein
MKEIKELTTLQVNMFLQREQEPLYKQQIDMKLREQNG